MNARWTRTLAIAAGLVACGGGAPPPQPHRSIPPAPAETAHDTPAPAPPAAPARDYPASRRADVAETLHGVEIHDPYRWLEDAAQPEVQAWMKAQDAYARGHLAKLPGRDALAARLAEVFYFDALGAPTHRGDRYFFTRKHKEQEKAILYWKQGVQRVESAAPTRCCSIPTSGRGMARRASRAGGRAPTAATSPTTRASTTPTRPR
jgi:prolyl oligopeptidase